MNATARAPTNLTLKIFSQPEISDAKAAMKDDAIQERYRAFFEAEFMPIIRYNQIQGALERRAYADE